MDRSQKIAIINILRGVQAQIDKRVARLRSKETRDWSAADRRFMMWVAKMEKGKVKHS